MVNIEIMIVVGNYCIQLLPVCIYLQRASDPRDIVLFSKNFNYIVWSVCLFVYLFVCFLFVWCMACIHDRKRDLGSVVRRCEDVKILFSFFKQVCLHWQL